MVKVTIRPLGYDQRDALIDVDQWGFSFDETGRDAELAVSALEWDRTFGAYVDDHGEESLAGINSTFSLGLPVPGGAELPCAGLTWVTVHPQFRRRGVLRAMIADHLAAAKAHGEPVSALHASEASIYGRFGYGSATPQVSMTLGRGAGLRDVPGAADVRVRFDTADAGRWADAVADCYDAARRDRPGMVSFPSPALRRERFDDEPVLRKGSEPLRIIVAEGEDGLRGFALWRRKNDWNDALPAGTVTVREFVARDAAAAHALWSRLLDLDLTATVEPDERPLDDPLLHLLENQREGKPVIRDGLWVRLVDLPAALAARRYAAPVDAVIEVRDGMLPENAGRWRLTGGPDGATCERAEGEPVLSLDVRELGAVYLGSVPLTAYTAAGLATADPAALPGLATAFSWPVAAYCGRGF